MMGKGPNGYGGSSNLSVLAPPFTVQKPLVDLTEPSSYLNWASDSKFDYFPVPNPDFDANSYNGYSSSTAHLSPPPPSHPQFRVSTDNGFYGQNSSPLFEAEPYYPSYAFSNDYPLGGVIHHSGYDLLSGSAGSSMVIDSSREDYTQSLSSQWGTMWDGPADWQQSEHVPLDGSFCSKNSYMNQGLYASENISKYEAASQSTGTIGRETQAESAGKEQLEFKPFLIENPKFLVTDYSTSSRLASTSPVPETCPQVPSTKTVNPWNYQMPYCGSYEKCLKRQDASSSDTVPVINSSPVVIKPPAQDSGTFMNVNTGSDRDINEFSCNNPSVVVKPHLSVTSKCNYSYDACQVSFHLGKTDPTIGKFCSTRNEELSSNRSVSVDSSDLLAGKKHAIQVPNTTLDGLSLADKNEAISPVKTCTDCIDHFSSAVDSPCWKGASVSNFSRIKVSEAVTSQNMKNFEACSGLEHKGYHTSAISSNDSEKVSREKATEKPIQYEDWSLENHQVSMTWPSVGNLLHREEADHNMTGVNCTNPNFLHQVQNSDAMYNKSPDNSDGKLPHNEPQGCEGNLTTESNCGPVIGVADVSINMNNDLDDYSSHVPFHAVENVLCSPPSADSTSTTLNKARGGESTKKTHVRTLIDTMHNLSELLVSHFSNDVCELKADDAEALKGVICNLESCMSNKVGSANSTMHSIFPQRTASQLLEKSFRLQKGTNENGFLASRMDSLEFQAPLKRQYDEEHIGTSSEKNDEKLSTDDSVRAAADMLRDDNLIQAIKQALTENFHDEEETESQALLYKNLWLEAEASLCYASCMARFNKMKIKMEKCDSPISKDLPEKNLVEEKVSRSDIYPGSCTSEMLTYKAKGSFLPDSFIPESTVLSTSSHPNDVTARFHMLKCRVDRSNSVNGSSLEKLLDSADKLSGSQVYLAPNHFEKTTFKEKNGQKPDKPIKDPPVSSIAGHIDDVEASVMERFHILKSRGDNSVSAGRTDSVGVGYSGLQKHWRTGADESEDVILEVNMEPDSQHNSSNSIEDKLTVKEIPVFVKDEPVMESPSINEGSDQPCAGFCEGSSDWEHVLVEELAGQKG